MVKHHVEQAAVSTPEPGQRKMRHSGRWAPYLAEGIGTFALVFAGCGAIMINSLSGGQVTHVGVGLVFGLVIMVMIYALGHISGASMNPARLLGPALIGWTWSDQWVYVLAPLVGAAAGAFVYRWLRETSGHAALLERAATQVSELGAHEER